MTESQAFSLCYVILSIQPPDYFLSEDYFLDMSTGEFVLWEALLPNARPGFSESALALAGSVTDAGGAPMSPTDAAIELYLSPELVLTPVLLQRCFLLALLLRSRANILVSGSSLHYS